VEEFGQYLIDGSVVGLQLRADNDTRWNSVYFMVERALLLRDPLQVFCARFAREKDLPAEDVLDSDDWIVLASIKELLKPLKKLTKQFEGRGIKFPEVIPRAHKLLSDLRTQYQFYTANPDPTPFSGSFLPPRQEEDIPPLPPAEAEGGRPGGRPQRSVSLPRHLNGYEVDAPGQRNRAPPAPPAPKEVIHVVPIPQPNPVPLPGPAGLNYIQKSIGYGISKLEKWIEQMEISPAYWNALILHPGYRTRWLERNVGGDRHLEIVAAFKAHFNEFYSSPLPQPPAPPQVALPANDLVDPHFYDPAEPQDIDEVEVYLGEPVRRVSDPVLWWKSNTERFPRLSQIALDLLSIPAMSDEPERAFS
jgi:hypothetical protein